MAEKLYKSNVKTVMHKSPNSHYTHNNGDLNNGHYSTDMIYEYTTQYKNEITTMQSDLNIDRETDSPYNPFDGIINKTMIATDYESSSLNPGFNEMTHHIPEITHHIPEITHHMPEMTSEHYEQSTEMVTETYTYDTYNTFLNHTQAHAHDGTFDESTMIYIVLGIIIIALIIIGLVLAIIYVRCKRVGFREIHGGDYESSFGQKSMQQLEKVEPVEDSSILRKK